MALGDVGNTQEERAAEDVSGWRKWIGQAHRRVSLLFTAAAAGSTTAPLAQREPGEWASLIPLLPHTRMRANGLYVFVLPDVAGTRSSADGSGNG